MSEKGAEEFAESSWVIYGSKSSINSVHASLTEQCMKLLRDAQRESNQSSSQQSLASSRIDSPKSPPNSPNTEPNIDDELISIYIDYCGNKVKEAQSECNSLWTSKATTNELIMTSPPVTPRGGEKDTHITRPEYRLNPMLFLPLFDRHVSGRNRQKVINMNLLIITNTMSFCFGVLITYFVYRP